MAVIQFLLKTLFSVLVLVLILVVCAVGLTVWSIPKFAPNLLDSWIESRTGFSAAVNSVNMKIFSGSLEIEGMALINPPYYQSKNFMQIKQISAQMEPKSLFKDMVVFDYVFFDLDRITWVKNAQGSINVMEFVDRLKKKRKSSIVSEESEQQKPKAKKTYLSKDYIIKKLIIKVGGIDVVGVPFENDTQNFALGYSKEFTDVTDIEAVFHQIAVDFTSRGVIDLTLDVLVKGVDKTVDVLGQKVNGKIQKGVEKAFRFLQKVTK